MLRENIKIPHNNRIRSLLDERVANIECHMVEDLPANAKVSISMDCWTSPNNLAFLAIMTYYINNDWTLREVLLGFEHLSGKHSGPNMASVVNRVLDQYDLKDRLQAVTTDNASNNSTMAAALRTTCSQFKQGCHLPCLAHVIQLAVKELLTKIDVFAMNEDVIKVWDSELLKGVSKKTGFAKTLEKMSLAIILAIVLAI